MVHQDVHLPSRDADEPAPLRLLWRHPRGLIGLSVVNMIYRIVTLGLYHFWAKTEVRKRIWSSIRFNDEPLTYTGRGLELFLGFLIVFGLIFLPVILILTGLILYFGPNSLIPNIAIVVLYVAFGWLAGLAVYRAQRYRLSRTRWRGIRGSMQGSGSAYAWTHFLTALLIPLTFGWLIPWRTTKLQSMITNNMHLGNRPFRFEATSGPLYGPFAMLWFGSIVLYLALLGVLWLHFFPKYTAAREAGLPFIPSPTDIGVVVLSFVVAGFVFALFSSWYRARTINHFAAHTFFEQARFRGRLTAGGLIWLSLSNFMILLVGAVAFLAIIAAATLPFIDIDYQNLRLPEGRAATQIFASIVPLALLIGFTLLAPIVQVRSVGYIVRNLSIEGTVSLAAIEQSAAEDIRYGEGLAEAFDIDAI
ncbi:MAG: YjgN family protein [Hyphomicrobiaceae bacterium]